MGRESSLKPNYQILAFVTKDKERYLGGEPLSLLAKDDKELQQLTTDIAKAMRADVVKLSSGEYIVIRV
jgi:hypothetical protein